MKKIQELLNRPLWVATIEGLCVLLSFVLILYLGLQLIFGVNHPFDVAIILVAAFLAYLTSDFVSGFFHWFFDRFFDEDTPFLGKYVIFPFRNHHRDPMAITRHDFVGRNGNNCFILNPVLIWAFFERSAVHQPWGLFWIAFAVFLGIGVSFTNQIHSWAHVSSTPRWVTKLQNLGLIISPTAHMQHHRGPHDRSFCITCGWLNPFLDRHQIFFKLEKLFIAVGVPLSRTLKTPSESFEHRVEKEIA